MAVPYTFGTATSAIPLSQLDNNFATTITLGNTAIQLGNTVTTLNNMTLANVSITSVGTTFPNSFLANSTTTLGNTTLTLGSTTTSVGNLTLTNVTISSGNATVATLTASADSSFTSTGAVLISKGTTGQQPSSPATGMLRYNTTSNQFEGYSGSSPAWNPVGGSTLSNDTATASNLYPTFANATSGTALTLYTSNAKLLYKPSTGELQSNIHVSLNGITVNSQTVSASYTIAAGYSGMSSGPVSVASGQSVTVASGSRWVVV